MAIRVCPKAPQHILSKAGGDGRGRLGRVVVIIQAEQVLHDVAVRGRLQVRSQRLSCRRAGRTG